MKKLLLLLLLSAFNFQSYGQDPSLYRTWYLYEVLVTDEGVYYNVPSINPPINPQITILEDLSFTGEGACNSFSGAFNFYEENTLDTNGTFTATEEDCGEQVHNSFENSFFGFIGNEFWYEITQESDELTLTASNPLMGYAIFKEFPLSASDNTFLNIEIYPNPTSEKLFINSNTTQINNITIYSVLGEKILSENSLQNKSINVSLLAKGIYFIEIISEKRRSIKKFIKK